MPQFSGSMLSMQTSKDMGKPSLPQWDQKNVPSTNFSALPKFEGQGSDWYSILRTQQLNHTDEMSRSRDFTHGRKQSADVADGFEYHSSNIIIPKPMKSPQDGFKPFFPDAKHLDGKSLDFKGNSGSFEIYKPNRQAMPIPSVITSNEPSFFRAQPPSFGSTEKFSKSKDLS